MTACGFPRPPDIFGDDAAVDAVVDSAGVDAAPVGPPPSCVALPHTCGAGRNHDCCHTIQVPGGTYFRSYDLIGDSQSGTTRFPATVSSFRLDKYEVTVARFRTFVAAGQGTQANPPAPGSGAHAKIAGSGWQAGWNTELPVDRTALLAQVNYCPTALLPDSWTNSPGANEDRPMTCLTWYEAMAFCIWDGGYLPTLAEWNYAAAGGDEQRAYPWSIPPSSLTIDSSYASYSTGTVNSPNCTGDGLPGCAVTDLVPVGTKPLGDGRWGHSDLAGNASEWLLDWEGYPATCIDCANLVVPVFDPPERLARGGSIMSLADGTFGVRIASEAGQDSPRNVGLTGVRCARAP